MVYPKDEAVDHTSDFSDDEDVSVEIQPSVKKRKRRQTPSRSQYQCRRDESDLPSRGRMVDDWEERTFLGRTRDIDMTAYFVATDHGMRVCNRSWSKLFDYQREGVSWLCRLYRERQGGILGDEMGLGKTAQVCCHLNSIASELPNASFLVVCPATLMRHWLNESHAWAPSLRVVIMHAVSDTFEELRLLGEETIARAVRKLQESSIQGVVVVMSYEGLRANISSISVIQWTAICLDEGQKIRNPDAEITLACKRLKASHRVILSGTPIQNSLLELWSLMDFACPGKLGTREVFDVEIATPIREGNYRNASKFRAELGVRTAVALQELIRPFLLR